jgi:hypothetical protein
MAGNHNSGRRANPAWLTKLKGNPGKRRLPPDPPTTVITLTDPPSHLSADAQARWRELVPADGKLTPRDVLLLDLLAVHVAIHRRLASRYQAVTEGAATGTPPGEVGFLMRSLRAEATVIRALALEYGRETARVEPVGRGEESAFDRLLKQSVALKRGRWHGVLP